MYKRQITSRDQFFNNWVLHAERFKAIKELAAAKQLTTEQEQLCAKALGDLNENMATMSSREGGGKRSGPDWLLAAKDVQVEKKIASGSFGYVYIGTYRGTMKCAVKQMIAEKVDEMSIALFRAEIELMSVLRHPGLSLIHI